MSETYTDATVAAIAEEFNEITKSYEAKELSHEEYVELCKDIQTSKLIAEQCANLDEMSSLNKAINIAIQVAAAAASAI
jgi:Cdc6-like AAA superfamily ATPase